MTTIITVLDVNSFQLFSFCLKHTEQWPSKLSQSNCRKLHNTYVKYTYTVTKYLYLIPSHLWKRQCFCLFQMKGGWKCSSLYTPTCLSLKTRPAALIGVRENRNPSTACSQQDTLSNFSHSLPVWPPFFAPTQVHSGTPNCPSAPGENLSTRREPLSG